MHKEILTEGQVNLFPLLEECKKDFILVGGTAIALYIGHRKSIDFDLFSFSEFNNTSIRRIIDKYTLVDRVLVNRKGELTLTAANKVQVTFFHYPFKLKANQWFNKIIKIPDLITLASMKAYALGMRAKWKDYVDLYFIIKNHYSLAEIIKKANQIFKDDFNPKIFRTQLSYFKDINYREKIKSLPGFEVEEEEVKKSLIDFSLE